MVEEKDGEARSTKRGKTQRKILEKNCREGKKKKVPKLGGEKNQRVRPHREKGNPPQRVSMGKKPGKIGEAIRKIEGKGDMN